MAVLHVRIKCRSGARVHPASAANRSAVFVGNGLAWHLVGRSGVIMTMLRVILHQLDDPRLHLFARTFAVTFAVAIIL